MKYSVWKKTLNKFDQVVKIFVNDKEGKKKNKTLILLIYTKFTNKCRRRTLE